MNQQGDDNPTIHEDLPIDQSRQDEVKGGTSFAGARVSKIVIDPRP